MTEEPIALPPARIADLLTVALLAALVAVARTRAPRPAA